jgi:hypothetical protein
VLDSAAADCVAQHPGSCLDVRNDFDVLWEVPTATIRRPDLALRNCAPDAVRPLPASYIDVHVLDHAVGTYRLLRTLGPEDEVSVLEVPVRIKVPWNELSALTR